MSRQHEHLHSPRPAVWFLLALGAGAAACAAWLVARTRRDRLVAEAGEVLHPVDTPVTPLPDAEGHVAGNDDAGHPEAHPGSEDRQDPAANDRP